MKKFKIIYFLTTGLLSALMLMSVSMYFFKHGEIAQAFTSLGYPAYLVYPLAIAKLLGLVAIWAGISSLLRDLAYSGFFFTFLLAFSAHLMTGIGSVAGPIFALALLGASFWSGGKLGAEQLSEKRRPLEIATNEG